MMRWLLALASVGAACLGLALAPASALADHTQISIFQDDEHLIDSSTATVEGTLGILHALGVEEIRVNLEWYTVAPDPLSYTEPQNFNATDPDDYPAGAWAPYDRLVDLAALAGMRVQFNLTAPGPLWAMGRHPPTTRAANHWYPNGLDFFDFVYAVGERYSGSPGDQPRVDNWSIWNEPNQPGWLAPQWAQVKGQEVRESPILYRQLADYAYYGLYFSGHADDSILIGETAPEGDETPGYYTAQTPLPWLRAVYCVNDALQPLRGPAASAEDCPTKGSVSKFVQANHVLFYATGYAHHPYYFFHSPSYSSNDEPNFIPLANLGRLGRFLDGTFHTYGVKRQIPIYFTEYGYDTKPPNPYQVVTPAEQAVWLNEADYMAWSNPRVKSVAQFLLFDSAPNSLYKPNTRDYWDTFQTGLMFANGTPKPALFSYRMPIWIPNPHVAPGASTFIWGQVRPADQSPAQKVEIQWRPAGKGSYRTIAVAQTVTDTGYLTARVKLPGSGFVKLSWTAPGFATIHSRAAPVTVSP